MRRYDGWANSPCKNYVHVWMKVNETTILVTIFSEVLMVEQFFLSPQVKRRAIISNKPIYTNCHSVTERLKAWNFSKLGNISISRRSQNFIEL